MAECGEGAGERPRDVSQTSDLDQRSGLCREEQDFQAARILSSPGWTFSRDALQLSPSSDMGHFRSGVDGGGRAVSPWRLRLPAESKSPCRKDVPAPAIDEVCPGLFFFGTLRGAFGFSNVIMPGFRATDCDR